MLAYFSAAPRTSLDTLPVCLRNENPNRLVSLWDIVNHFNAVQLCLAMGNFAMFQAKFEDARASARRPDPQDVANLLGQIIHVSRSCEQAGMTDLVMRFNGIQRHLTDRLPDTSTLVVESLHCREYLLEELGKRNFLYVEPDRVEYLESDDSSGEAQREDLFGNAVTIAFPSTADDIKEAGNCLAAECSTGAVFHLMRAAEIALRALAKDRGVSYPHSSVDDQQCGTLITSLDAKLSALRGADKKHWPAEAVKTEQIRFYHAATIEFRSFNEAWRKHVCHAGSDSFYDRHQALSIFKHVGNFMRGLAPKISESSTTPEYWTS